MNTFRLELLADHPEVLRSLKEWFEGKWNPYYGPNGPGDATADLQESCNRDELPITVVAFLDDEVVGTAALKMESVSTHKHLTPWLGALLVKPEYRRRGIAELLIKEIENKAKDFGFHIIYVGTGKGSGTPQSALLKRGWEFVEKSSYYISEVQIFKKQI